MHLLLSGCFFWIFLYLQGVQFTSLSSISIYFSKSIECLSGSVILVKSTIDIFCFMWSLFYSTIVIFRSILFSAIQTKSTLVGREQKSHYRGLLMRVEIPTEKQRVWTVVAMWGPCFSICVICGLRLQSIGLPEVLFNNSCNESYKAGNYAEAALLSPNGRMKSAFLRFYGQVLGMM